MLVHWATLDGRYVVPTGHIIPLLSYPIFSLTYLWCILRGKTTNSKYHRGWFDPTGVRARDILHLRWARLPLHPDVFAEYVFNYIVLSKIRKYFNFRGKIFTFPFTLQGYRDRNINIWMVYFSCQMDAYYHK